MRRRLAAVVVSVMAAMLLVLPAGAGVTWCRADPIVEFNGTEVQVWVAIEADYERFVTGPIEVTFFSPRSVSKEITYLDAGFNGHGEEVIFKNRGRVADDGSFQVDIKVNVPLDSRELRREFGVQDVAIQVEIISGGQLIRLTGNQQGARVSLQVQGEQ